jgi:hypothetical protein
METVERAVKPTGALLAVRPRPTPRPTATATSRARNSAETMYTRVDQPPAAAAPTTAASEDGAAGALAVESDMARDARDLFRVGASARVDF